MPHDIHQVRRVTAIKYAEAGLETHRRAVPPEQPVRNGMKRPGPRKAHVLPDVRNDSLRAARHLQRRAAGKCQQQNPFGACALEDEVGHAMGQGVGLARSGARDDEERAGHGAAAAEPRGLALALIERVEGGCVFHGRNYKPFAGHSYRLSSVSALDGNRQVLSSQ
jgi:hypothetical protein